MIKFKTYNLSKAEMVKALYEYALIKLLDGANNPKGYAKLDIKIANQVVENCNFVDRIFGTIIKAEFNKKGLLDYFYDLNYGEGAALAAMKFYLENLKEASASNNLN